MKTLEEKVEEIRKARRDAKTNRNDARALLEDADKRAKAMNEHAERLDRQVTELIRKLFDEEPDA